MVRGYTDGTYNYYHDTEHYGNWWAVMGQYGHAVAQAKTRTECARIAHSAETLEKLAKLDAKKFTHARELYLHGMEEVANELCKAMED